MRKIIKEISRLNIDENEKEEFIRFFLNRELEKDERARKILFNSIKEATKGKRLVFSK
jgi:hypothetical protein